MAAQEEQYFKFAQQKRVLVFVDGNYMVNLSRALSIKIDMENLMNDITSEFFRKKTFWYSAIEYNVDRNNNAFRFLDRLRYIPRTQVYIGRLTKQQGGNYDTALRTDAGTALISTMIDQSHHSDIDYIILIGIDPEYIPAVKTVQRYGKIVRLVTADAYGDLRAHPELIKAVDERFFMTEGYLHDFEYRASNHYLDDDDDDEMYEDGYDDDEPRDQSNKEKSQEDELEVQTTEIDE